MRTIKYLNPRTGEQKRVKICDPSYAAMQSWRVADVLRLKASPRRPTMAEADELMGRKGFLRCGLRWGSRAARRALAQSKENA